jgi:SagB-type dehydrogenase family enzyme
VSEEDSVTVAGRSLPTELDRTTYPAFREAVAEAEMLGLAAPGPPRSYPGYPRQPLERVRPRLFGPSLDHALARRRCIRTLGLHQPSRPVLSRLLFAAHGVTGPASGGPVPSSGGLQALELYLAVLEPGWLEAGAHHYDRAGHHLSRLVEGGGRADWAPLVPSLGLVVGGSVLWLIIGDGARVGGKYGGRGLRFLLLEAGHLMQNLCLLSGGLGLATVPLGGFLEQDLARRLQLPAEDVVLYAGVCGPIAPRAPRAK